MLRCSNFLIVLLLLSPAVGFAKEVPMGDPPAFTAVPELSIGFDLRYVQKFAKARQIFESGGSRNQENPFGEVAVAASYLFEECENWGSPVSVTLLRNFCFLSLDDSESELGGGSGTAPIASGRSEPVPGRDFQPAVDQRLFTAHQQPLARRKTRIA
jgi:hypothetical protein